jgi:hypothetical protein
MRAVVGPSASAPGKQVVEETKKTTTEIPTPPENQTRTRIPREKRAHINSWFASLAPDERAKDYSFSIYRDDPRIIIVDEQLDDRASGKMLDKITEEELRQWPDGPFLQELTLWTKERYGGGEYHVYVVMRKGSTLMYNKGYSADGQPKLSAREGWKDGEGPAGGGGAPDQWAVRTLIEFIDKKLDAAKLGQADPGLAFSQITQAVMDSNSKALGFIIANLPKTDPMQQMEQLKMMLDVAKSLQPPAQATAPPVAPPLSPVQQMREIMELEKLMQERNGGHAGITPATLTTAVSEGFKQIGNVSKKVSGWVEFGQAIAPFAPVLQPLVTEAVAFFRARRQAQAQPGAPQPGMRIVARGGPINQQPAAPVAAGGGVAGGSAGGPIPAGSYPGGGQVPPGGPQAHAGAAPQAAPQQPMAPQNGEWNIPQEAVDDMMWQVACARVVDMLEHNRTGEDAAAMLDDAFPEISAQFEMMSLADLQRALAEDPILSRAKGHPKAFAFGKAFYDFFHQAEPVAP